MVMNKPYQIKVIVTVYYVDNMLSHPADKKRNT